ncbi:MAG: FkbM family methyltransferase [Puniceicoccales bacterium]|nr:FkbM family methyltransferase [Puniceicoccales bacterium]
MANTVLQKKIQTDRPGAHWSLPAALLAVFWLLPSTLPARGIINGGSTEESSTFQVSDAKFYLPHSQTDAPQKEAVHTKDYPEKAMLKEVASLLPPNAIVVEIGAGIGLHSCFWATEGGAERVIAFEPVSSVHGAFLRNIEINCLRKKIKVHKIALSDEAGSVAVDSAEATSPSAIRLKKVIAGEGTISAKRLDSIDLGVDRIDLVEITANGFEPKILAGALETIEHYRPQYILVELEMNAKETKRILAEMNYVREKKFSKDRALYRKSIE